MVSSVVVTDLGHSMQNKALYLNFGIDTLISPCELIPSYLRRWMVSNDGFVISLKLPLFK